MYSEAIDCFEWAVSRPLEHPPGSVGRYRNCDPLALGYLVRQSVEANCEELGEYLTYPQRRLFDKLG
jgi:CubicO group peptidase (beta-lactamase class C family)